MVVNKAHPCWSHSEPFVLIHTHFDHCHFFPQIQTKYHDSQPFSAILSHSYQFSLRQSHPLSAFTAILSHPHLFWPNLTQYQHSQQYPAILSHFCQFLPIRTILRHSQTFTPNVWGEFTAFLSYSTPFFSILTHSDLSHTFSNSLTLHSHSQPFLSILTHSDWPCSHILTYFYLLSPSINIHSNEQPL